jgi:putative MATE family efflux protein
MPMPVSITLIFICSLLLSLFLVDLLDLYFISLLGETELAAAIGFAGTILFFTASISIGLSIGASVVMSKAVGEGNIEETKKVVLSTLSFSALFAVAVFIITLPLAPLILSKLGATGRTHDLALDYLYILLPSLPLLGIGMCAGGILRAIGDAKGAMMVTLTGGLVNAVFDPILIFGLDMGIEGAAVSSVLARSAIAGVGIYLIFYKHNLKSHFTVKAVKRYLKPMMLVANPAILANVATPIGIAYSVATIANFGDSAIAGNTIVARITPVAFAFLFSLSGAVGPIIGQNLGAGLHDRVRETIIDSLKFTAGYILLMWPIFYFGQDLLTSFFGASPDSASMVQVFSTWVVPLTFFTGALFVSNAAFNNLGYPMRATYFNVGRATFGTIPFVYYGAEYYGAQGVLIGQAIGGAIIGAISIVACLKTVANLRNTSITDHNIDDNIIISRPPLTAYSSARTFNCPTHELTEKHFIKPTKLDA